MIGIENRSRDTACKAPIPETKCLEDCKMNKTVSYLLFLGVCLSLAGSAFGMIPIPVGNADFEDRPMAPGNYSYNIAPWEWIATPLGVYDPWIDHGYYGGEPTPLTQSLVTEGHIVYQTLSATYQGGHAYVFSVDVGANWGDDDWEIFFFDATTADAETPLVSLSSIDTGQGPIPEEGQWFRKSITFVPAVEQVGHTIGIGFTGEQFVMFDNVTVEYQRGAPATLVAPIDWAYADLALLEWERPTPLVGGETILVNVYFGTDPNLIPGVNGTLQIETAQDIDETGAFLPQPLVLDTVYSWRVDCIDPNGGNGDVITKGDTWSFATTVPPGVIVTESGGSTEVGEGDRLANRDDYILRLTMDPGAGVSVSVTVSEVPVLLNPTTTRETMEAYNGEADNAPELQVTLSGGAAVSSRVSSGADDTEEWLPDEWNYPASSDLEFFDDGGGQIIGLRFQNVAIEQGAAIDSAIVEFEVDETNATGEVHGIITGENVDNAPALAVEYNILRDRLAANPTTATSSFAWTADYAVNTKVPTSDISDIIQEIVNRASWASGNSIVLFFTEDMTTDEPDIEFIDATDPWAPRSSTYVLDSSNWETGVTVTIAAIDDSLIEVDPEPVTLAATTSSADSAWDGLSVADVTVFVLENDCGAWGYLPLDLNKDCVINLGDLAMFASQFGMCTDPHFPAICDDDR